MIQKLKSFIATDAYFYSLLLILVAVASFGLGRESAKQQIEYSSAPVVRQTEPLQLRPLVNEVTVETAANTVVASRSGSRYHLPSCPGAKQIKEANLISFQSVGAAKAAGYTPAANCPGLE